MRPSAETKVELDEELRRLEERLAALEEACTKLEGCESEEEKNKAALDGRLALVDLRGIHRNVLRGTKDQQDQAQEAILAADRAHRVLHAANYEKEFIQSKLNAAKEKLGRRFEADLGLLPLETFRTEAPEELQRNTETQHRLLIARVKFEESKRKDLALQKDAQLQKKLEQEKRVAEKRKMLESLYGEAKILKRQTTPLWDKLMLKRPPASGPAALLPKPLYVLHSRIKHFFEKNKHSVLLEVSEGFVQEAPAQAASVSRMDTSGPGANHREGESMEVEEETMTMSCRRAAEPDRHPSVMLHILHGDTKEKLVSLTFDYHRNINAVIARCLYPSGSTVLDDVMPAPGNMEEEEGTLQEYKVHRWVQYLAGLEAAGVGDETEWLSTEHIMQQLLEHASEAPRV